MINLRSISTAVLSCLVLAAPASAAESSIHLSLPESAYLGTPVSATVAVSGEAPAHRKYGVAFLHAGTPVANCGKAVEEGSASVTAVASSTVVSTVEGSVALPLVNYETLGTYTLCAYVQRNEPTPAEAHASFTVVNPPPPPPVVTPPAPPAPVVTPPAPVVTPPVIHALTSAQKLHAALAKCKKQKNKRKRVKCERTARTAAKHH